MKRVLLCMLTMAMIAAFAGCGQTPAQTSSQPEHDESAQDTQEPTQEAFVEETLDNVEDGEVAEEMEKKEFVTVIVAFEGYQDVEHAGVANALDASEYKMQLVSTKAGQATGSNGGNVQVEKAIEDVSDYGLGVVIVGEPGSYDLWENKELHALVQNADENDDLVAAICAAPGVLANAGLLDGASACWYNEPGLDEVMKGIGCTDTGQQVSAYENIITGNGPDAGDAFGQAIVAYLDAM